MIRSCAYIKKKSELKKIELRYHMFKLLFPQKELITLSQLVESQQSTDLYIAPYGLHSINVSGCGQMAAFSTGI